MLHAYVEDSNIPVRAEIPTVCAAKHGEADTIRVADNFNAVARNGTQPLYTGANTKKDKEYVNALSVISTYAFERAAIKDDSTPASKGSKPAENISTIEFLDAADVIRERTHASSVLYLGVLGTSMTSAKVAAGYIGSVLVGTTTGVLTAGLGTGYYLLFTSGYQVSGRFMEGALIDLESGSLTWSNAVKVGGNPIKPETWSNQDVLDLLFHELLFQKTATK